MAGALPGPGLDKALINTTIEAAKEFAHSRQKCSALSHPIILNTLFSGPRPQAYSTNSQPFPRLMEKHAAGVISNAYLHTPKTCAELSNDDRELGWSHRLICLETRCDCPGERLLQHVIQGRTIGVLDPALQKKRGTQSSSLIAGHCVLCTCTTCLSKYILLTRFYLKPVIHQVFQAYACHSLCIQQWRSMQLRAAHCLFGTVDVGR